jgi:integrase
VTVGQAVEAYLAWGRSEGKYVDQHYSQYATHLRDKIHATPIVNVTPDLLSALKGELLKTPAGKVKAKKSDKANPRKFLAGSTVNNIFNFMRSSINRAIATNLWSGHNPLSTKGGVWKMVKVNNSRLRFLTRDEAKKLLAELEVAHPQLHDMALLSLKTGLRATEIFKLRGQDVDANAGVLHIIGKGGTRVPVRVPADIITMLAAYHRGPGEPLFKTPITGEALSKTPQALHGHKKTRLPILVNAGPMPCSRQLSSIRLWMPYSSCTSFGESIFFRFGPDCSIPFNPERTAETMIFVRSSGIVTIMECPFIFI